MEDIKAYIESGVLELYVLGELSHDERVDVDAMALKHPAIKAELQEIEQTMLAYADAHKIETSPALRSRILNSLLTNLGDDRTFDKKPALAAQAKVVQMNTPKIVNFYKYAFAACLALLLVSVVALFNVYNKLQSSTEQVAALSSQRDQFARNTSLKDDELKVLRDTAYKIIHLPGTGKTPSASMSLAWSPAKKKVIIDMDGMNLPANDKDHQYQLWAIVAGKPVDLGVFDAKSDSVALMKVMKSVDKPQAFAVTLEPKGGSINPTMGNMTVIATI